MVNMVINPASKSGHGLEMWKELEDWLLKHSIEYEAFLSKGPGDVTRIVHELCENGLSKASSMLRIIILGGDGTFNEALQGITDFDCVEIGYIPTGSSNDLARDLGIKGDPSFLLSRILVCDKPHFMDLGRLTYHDSASERSRLHEEKDSDTRYFAVSCGIGYDAAICEEALASHFKNTLNRLGLGKLTYLTIALKQLILTKRGNCTITLDGKEPFELKSFLFIATMIHRFEGGGFMFCPDADAQDGRFNLCAVGPIAKLRILFALPSALKGQHYRYPHIYPYDGASVHIEADRPFWVHTDGEVSRKSSSITIECLQKKIHLLK